MRSRTGQLGVGVLAAAAAAAIAIAAARVEVAAAENTGFISGVVTSGKGPEAGVWVIAETQGLRRQSSARSSSPTIRAASSCPSCRLRELRALGARLRARRLEADDRQVRAADVKLAAVLAPTPQEAAQSLSRQLLGVDAQAAGSQRVPRHRAQGQRHRAGDDDAERLDQHHQSRADVAIRSAASRRGSIPDRDKFASSIAAWDHRVQRGQRGPEMSAFMTGFGRERGLKMFADWTDTHQERRRAARRRRVRSGIERNVVITMWNWGDEYGFIHDEIATDRRNPRDRMPTAWSTASTGPTTGS